MTTIEIEHEVCEKCGQPVRPWVEIRVTVQAHPQLLDKIIEELEKSETNRRQQAEFRCYVDRDAPMSEEVEIWTCVRYGKTPFTQYNTRCIFGAALWRALEWFTEHRGSMKPWIGDIRWGDPRWVYLPGEQQGPE